MEIRTLEKIINFDTTRTTALCTQVEWRGSVPRKDYPLMLVDDSGEIIGTIGGGALEHSVIEIAQEVIKTGKPVLNKFDLTNEDVNKSASICGGTTTVLIEPYSLEIRNLLRSIFNDNTNDNIIITKISTHNDVLIKRTKVTKNYESNFPLTIVNTIKNVIEQQKSISINYKDELYLIQNTGSRPILHIFGAGHVGKAVADLAHFIELDTKIYDERVELANSERFPFALQIDSNDISEIINNTNIGKTDYVLVATRGHQHDFELMKWLTDIEIDYLSLMSSNKKWELLSQALFNNGVTQRQINKVHSPVGLNVGSETVPEIAVSIIAEIVNHYRNYTKSAISLSI